MLIYKLFNSGVTGMALFALIVAYLLAILFALSSHEFAHAYVAYKQGDDTPKYLGRLTLNPLAHLDPVGAIMLVLVGFGWAKPVECNPLKFKKMKSGMIKVSLAGVTINFITAIIFSFFFILSLLYADATTTLGCFIIYFCEYMTMISFSLGVFNLLPIPPLDGYMFLSTLVNNDNAFMSFLRKYGFIILIVFLITPIFEIVFDFLFANTISNLFLLWQMLLL